MSDMNYKICRNLEKGLRNELYQYKSKKVEHLVDLVVWICVLWSYLFLGCIRIYHLKESKIFKRENSEEEIIIGMTQLK